MKNLKFNNNLLYLIIAVVVVLMLIFAQRREVKVEFVEEVGESVGSGFLEIETFPSDADIFVDGVFSGKSPDTLYNIPSGTHNIVIKEDGYEDFIKEIVIEAGRKTFLEANLVLIPVVEEEIIETVEEYVEVIEAVEDEIESIEDIGEETLTETALEGNIVNIGNKFILYYDFSEGEFADKRNFEQDVFSKRYETYLVFTRFDPVNIKIVDKSIDDVQKEDCIGVKGTFEYLYSEQSLCVKTKDGNIAAIGGTWQSTENAELTFKVFS